MPYAKINGTKLYYEITGEGPETVVFAHGLLCSTKLFEHQVKELSKHYQCLSFDFKGQGRSEAPHDIYDMDTLTDETVELLQFLQIKSCHFVGLSMGGFVGMRLAARHPHLINSLGLLATSAEAESKALAPLFTVLSRLSLIAGKKISASVASKILFGKSFRRDKNRSHLKAEWRRNLKENNFSMLPKIAGGVFLRDSVLPELHNVNIPTLILVGSEDWITPEKSARQMQGAIKDSILHVIPKAGHTLCVEAAEEVSLKLFEFYRLGRNCP